VFQYGINFATITSSRPEAVTPAPPSHFPMSMFCPSCPLSDLNMRTFFTRLCYKPGLRVTISSLQHLFFFVGTSICIPRYDASSLAFWGFRLLYRHSVNTTSWCLVGSMVCLGIELGLIMILRRSSLKSPSVSSASVSGGLSSSTVTAHLFYVVIRFPSHQMIPATEIIAARHVSVLCFTQSSVCSRCQCHTIWLY
jgi:hypothetical protein